MDRVVLLVHIGHLLQARHPSVHTFGCDCNHVPKLWAYAQGMMMLLCVAAFDWPAEAAKAMLGAGRLQQLPGDAPAVQPLLSSDVCFGEDPGAASAQANGGHDAVP